MRPTPMTPWPRTWQSTGRTTSRRLWRQVWCCPCLLCCTVAWPSIERKLSNGLLVAQPRSGPPCMHSTSDIHPQRARSLPLLEGKLLSRAREAEPCLVDHALCAVRRHLEWESRYSGPKLPVIPLREPLEGLEVVGLLVPCTCNIVVSLHCKEAARPCCCCGH